MVADGLRLVGEVVGVDADAVPTDEARAESEEVPLRAGCQQHVFGVDAEPVEEHGELVDQGDVDIALSVLDDLGSLGDLDRGGAVGASGDDGAVESVNKVGHLRGGAGRHLDDRGQAVLAVTRVDPLRAVTDEEVAVEDQPGDLLEDRHALLLGCTRVDRRLVDHHVTGA